MYQEFLNDCFIPLSYLKITANNLDRVNLSPLLLGKTAAKISVKSPAREFKKSLYNQVLLLVCSENCTFSFNYVILASLILIGTTMKLTPCDVNPQMSKYILNFEKGEPY